MAGIGRAVGKKEEGEKIGNSLIVSGLWRAARAGGIVKKREGFGEAGVFEEMSQAWIEGGLFDAPVFDREGNFLERGEMSGGVAVPPSVIGDDGFTLAEKFTELFGGREIRRHGGRGMEWFRARVLRAAR